MFITLAGLPIKLLKLDAPEVAVEVINPLDAIDIPDPAVKAFTALALVKYRLVLSTTLAV